MPHLVGDSKLNPLSQRTADHSRSFSVGAARLWNELPQHFMPPEDNESFKRELKTWLFRKAYGE
jgi:hypothetical protein